MSVGHCCFPYQSCMHPLFFLYDRAKSSVLKNVFSSTIGETEEVGDDDDDARSVQNLQNVRFIHRGKSIPLAKTDDGVFVVVAVVVLGGAPPSSIDNDDEDFLSCCCNVQRLSPKPSYKVAQDPREPIFRCLET